MGITVDTDKDDFRIKGDDGTYNGQLIGSVDDRLKVSVLEYDENAPNTAFPVRLPTVTDMTNRIRVAIANQILETTWQYDLLPRIYSTSVTGAGTVTAPAQTDPAYAKIATTTASGDLAVLQTKRFLIYQPFRTHILTMGMILGQGKTNLVKRFGQFSNFNGWYFEQSGSNFYVGYRNNSFEVSGTIDTKIERASWNIDKLDGTGPSGLDIDTDLHNALTFYIEFVWHGTQGIIWGIQYFDRQFAVHRLIWSTTANKPFVRSALLPVRYEMENTGAVASASTWFVGPNSFNIEGGEERKGQRFTASNATTSKLVNNTTTPTLILAVRPKEFFNSVRNRGTIIPLEYSVLTDNDIFVEILIQSIVTGGTWISVDNTSISEYNTTFTSISGGYVVGGGYAGAAGNVAGSLANTFEANAFVCQDALNSNAQLAIVIRARKLGNNADVYGQLKWKEVY